MRSFSSLFGLNAGKYGPEKLCIWTLFTQRILMLKRYILLRYIQVPIFVACPISDLARPLCFPTDI